jgi:uncharacterized protein (TIGR03435 family)
MSAGSSPRAAREPTVSLLLFVASCLPNRFDSQVNATSIIAIRMSFMLVALVTEALREVWRGVAFGFVAPLLFQTQIAIRRGGMKNAILLALLAAVLAQSQEQPKFDMADVHGSTTVHGAAQNVGGVLAEGRYVNRDATMLQLIETAWGVPEDAISGGPSWVSLDLFDVLAKVPNGTTPAAAHLMLQNLLADRFGLVISRGSHPAPRYLLSVMKGGSKLKSASGSGDPECQPVQQPAPANPADPASIPNIKVQCRNVTAAAIAENLRRMAGGYLDHDVIDSTGLDGVYDFDLEWTDHPLLAVKGADGISFFTAVEKRLGLRLEIQNVSVPSFVIETVNRRPSPNPTGIETSLVTAAARFEAASIKLADPAKSFTGVSYAGGTQVHAGGTLRQLIALALQIPPDVAADTVIGLPKSADDVRWDIVAKMPGTGEGAPRLVQGRRQPPPFSVTLEMLRGLLVDSFQMKTHIQNRQVTVHVLTVAGKKSKMTRADEAERSLCNPDNNARRSASTLMKVMSCKNTTMEEFAVRLPQWAGLYIDHPIVEGTGLPGGWDFVLGWTPKTMMPAVPSPGTNMTPGDTTAPGGITVFEAMRQELGLTLVKQKRSIPVIVVDHVDEQPLE